MKHLFAPFLTCVFALMLSYTGFAQALMTISPTATIALTTLVEKADTFHPNTVNNHAATSLETKTAIVQAASKTGLNAVDTTLFTQGFFYSALLMIVLANVFFSFIYSEKVFNYFSLALLASAILFFNADTLFSLFVIDVSSISVALTTTLVCITAGLTALFSSTFLSIEEHFPKLKFFTVPMFIYTALVTVLTWFADSAVFTTVSFVLSIAIMGSYFGAGILLLRKTTILNFM